MGGDREPIILFRICVTTVVLVILGAALEVDSRLPCSPRRLVSRKGFGAFAREDARARVTSLLTPDPFRDTQSAKRAP